MDSVSAIDLPRLWDRDGSVGLMLDGVVVAARSNMPVVSSFMSSLCSISEKMEQLTLKTLVDCGSEVNSMLTHVQKISGCRSSRLDAMLLIISLSVSAVSIHLSLLSASFTSVAFEAPPGGGASNASTLSMRSCTPDLGKSGQLR